MSEITSNAFLVRVSASQWSPRKLDRKATKEARSAAGANDKAGVALYKRVLAADALDRVSSIAAAASAEHRKRTVPWQYSGPGAITAEGYPEYMRVMEAFRVDFEAGVKAFLACYDTERAAAPANLGKLYDPADYPPLSEVASSFAFSVLAEPMPQSADFRVAGLSADASAAIKSDMDRRFKTAVQSAQQEAWDRIVCHVEKLQAKLVAFKPGDGADKKAEGIFRDTLVTNVQELINVLPSLNITGDPELTAITDRLQRELCAVSAPDLRESDALRADVAQKAQAVLQDIWSKRRAARGEQQAAAA